MKAAMQLKRRDRQSQISAHRREAMLLSRRIRRQDSANHSLLQSPTVAVPEHWNKAGFLKQTALTILEPPSLAEKAADHEVCATTSRDNLEKGKSILDLSAASHQACMTTSLGNLDKGNGILDPPIIRETGSTSGTSNPCHVTFNAVPIKAHRRAKKAKKVCLVSKEQRSEYVALKKVPNCQYCRAKKFEYEPPGFYCKSGSIRLTCHKMPTELLELYFGNTEESENFRTYIRTYNNMFAFTSHGVKYDKDLVRRNSGIYTFRV
nr:uncharacterized protein LOC104114668 isoform X3 [Nicotiana tomentosiformis]